MEEGGCETRSWLGGDTDLKVGACAQGRSMGNGKACGADGLGCTEFEWGASEVLEAGSWAERIGAIAIDGSRSSGLGY